MTVRPESSQRKPSRPQIVKAAVEAITSAGLRVVVRCGSDGSLEVEGLPLDSSPLPGLDKKRLKAGNSIESAFANGKQANRHGKN
jgi:hypothetical protein